MFQRPFDASGVGTAHDEHAVGDLARRLQGLRAARRHDDGNVRPRRIEFDLQTAQLRAFAGENAAPQSRRFTHKLQGRSLPSDDIGRAITGAVRDLSAAIRHLVQRDDGAADGHRMACDWIGDPRPEPNFRCLQRRASEMHVNITPQPGEQRRVRDPHEIESVRLDLPGVGSRVLGGTDHRDPKTVFDCHGIHSRKINGKGPNDNPSRKFARIGQDDRNTGSCDRNSVRRPR